MSTSSSSESDIEMLQQLSDWDSDTEDENNSFQSNRIKYRVNYIEELSDFDFIYRFRLNKSAVTNLLSEIYPYLKVTSSRNNGISPLHQVLLTLRYYALGTMLVSVADYVGVSISSACRIVESVSSAIAKLYNKYIKIEDHTQDQFYAIAGFPRVHGAIDCTHILIQSPGSTNAEEFRNRKGTFSLNVQGVCNAQLLFLNVVARWPGSSHDSTIFNNSVLRSQCENGALGNRWLLGDSAYPCSSYLLTPLLNPISRSEQLYNEAHIKTRNTIERCFGVWKRRFPVLSLKIRLSLAKTQPVIIATAVLHNICRKYNIQDVEPEVEVPRYQSLPTEQLSVQGLNNERLQLINNYFARFQH